jgi:hypothetical protein
MTVGDKHKVNARVEKRHQPPQQDRLARSHVSRDEHATLLALNAMNKRRQTLEIDRVTVKESRVGRYAEGRFSKSKMTLKHGLVFLSCGKFDHWLTLLVKAGWIMANVIRFVSDCREHD